MTCRRLTELVTDYLERRMPLGRRVAFRLHLATCGHCRAYLRQVRKTIALLGRLPDEPMPPAVEAELLRRFESW